MRNSMVNYSIIFGILLANFYFVQNVSYRNVSSISDIIVKVAKAEYCSCIYVADINKRKELYFSLRKSVSEYFLSSVLNIPEDVDEIKTTLPCYNPLIVVINLDISLIPLGINMATTTWLIFDDSKLPVEDILEDVDVAFDACVIIAKQNDNDDKIKLISVYRVANGYPLNVANSNGNCWRNQRRDLEQVTFRTATTKDEPDAYFDEDGRPVGYLPSIWAALQPTMNFTTFNRRYEGPIGSFYNGSWTGSIGEVINNSYDVILFDFDMTAERMSVLSLPQTLQTSRYQLYFKRIGLSNSYSALLKPLHYSVWAAIVGWIFAGAFILYSATNIYDATAQDSWKNMGFTESIFFLLQSLSMQGSPDVPKKPAFRMMFLTTYLVAAVLVPSYSASLVSSLTRRSPAMPFMKFEDILDSKYSLKVHRESAEYNYVNTTRNKIYQRISQEKLISAGGIHLYTKFIEEICGIKNTAAIAGELHMDYTIYEATRKNPKICQIDKIQQNLPIVHQTMAFRKGSSYQTAFNQRFLQLREVGILKREQLITWEKLVNPPKTYNEITLTDVTPIFIMLGAGNAVAILLLFYERLRPSKYRLSTTSSLLKTKSGVVRRRSIP